jgi:uncharacterized protein YlaI
MQKYVTLVPTSRPFQSRGVRWLASIDRDSVEVFLPDPDECDERLRRARSPATVSCVYCGESEPVITKRTTGKRARQYRCEECETYFDDLTDSFLEHRKFPIEEMVSTITERRSVPTPQSTSDLDRDDEAVSNFRHDLRELSGELTELTLSDLCEVDEGAVTAGENGHSRVPIRTSRGKTYAFPGNIDVYAPQDHGV